MLDLSPDALPPLIEGLITAALEAGERILKILEAGFDVETKADSSPVTLADRAAEAVILEHLQRLAPGVPVVAEEEAAAGRTPSVGELFFLVDPLDGTREFVRRGTDFTVNIGLIRERVPVLGIVFAPARDELYWGDGLGGGGYLKRGGRSAQRLSVREPHDPPTALASRSHDTPATEAYLRLIGAGERISIGSSLKFGLLARGEADVYPRPTETSEWDTAAGHAILIAAGGRAEGPDGGPLLYGKPRFLNPGFVAAGPLKTPPIAPYMSAKAP